MNTRQGALVESQSLEGPSANIAYQARTYSFGTTASYTAGPVTLDDVANALGQVAPGVDIFLHAVQDFMRARTQDIRQMFQ